MPSAIGETQTIYFVQLEPAQIFQKKKKKEGDKKL